MPRQRTSIRRAAMLLAVGLLAATAACNYQPAPPQPSPVTNPAAPAPSSVNTGPQSTATTSSAAAPPSIAAASATAPSAGGTPATYSVQLSAGVALPQSLPEGTRMLFSVDYQCPGVGTSPMSVVWVIQRSKGAPIRAPMPLQASGTLTAKSDWPPGDEPYSCRIEDAYGRPLSADAPMR